MTSDGVLSEGVRTLLRTAAGLLPANGLGVVRPEGAERVVLTYVDAFGATAYRGRERDVPEAVRPRTGPLLRLTAAELDANREGLFESRVRYTGFPHPIREECAARQVLTLPVRGADEPTTLIVGLATADSVTAAQVSEIESLAATVVDVLNPAGSVESELDLLRRLEAVEQLLTTLFRVLDVREIFDRLSAIAKDVLRHDFASLGLLSDDLERMELYVQTSPGSFFPQGGRMPFPRVQTATWLYRFVDDLRAHPLERNLESARAGGRTSIRVAIRLDDHILGVLNFTSRDPAPYTAADLAIARRIADYVALALSHQRLAEEARRNEELRARAEKSDLLDEVLASVTGAGELPQVFDRVSTAVQKVLAHDALVLAVRLPDGVNARIYAGTASGNAHFPEVIPVPKALLADPAWEFHIVDDLAADAGELPQWSTKSGYRSTLRLPIRLDNEFVGGLSFLSYTPGLYTPADVPVARRIADRVALSFARERGATLLKRVDEATARASKLEARVRALTEELDARTGYRHLVGESPEWRQVLTQATQVASTETTVLLLGESGTGKEVVARFLHRASPRATGPFVALNCAALPEQLLEAELFGYERGAYTGATQSKPGQLEQAAGGTLFLDEVGEMSLPAQAKFLRVLQEREFQRLGGTRVLRTDARIVAATNRDLQKAMGYGQFREDLYYRLNVFAIRLPPLRERRSDIVPLSEALLTEIGRGLGRPPAGISRDVRTLLVEYHWPGNVRELRNILERASILCDGGLITTEHLSLAIPPPSSTIPARTPPPVATPARPSSAGELQSLEREMIEQALRTARFNKSKAAKALGLTRQQLYLRMRKYGVD
jgi:transcriptional regulator with GAF, ATPase, and Fis domain